MIDNVGFHHMRAHVYYVMNENEVTYIIRS